MSFSKVKLCDLLYILAMKKILSILFFIAIIFTAGTVEAHPRGIPLWGHSLYITLESSAQLKIDYQLEVPAEKFSLLMHRYKNIRGVAEMGPVEISAFDDEFMERLREGVVVSCDGGIPSAAKWNPDYERKRDLIEEGFLTYSLHLIAAPCAASDGDHRIIVENKNYPIQRAIFHSELIDGDGGYVGESKLPIDMGWVEGDENRSIEFQYRSGARPEGERRERSKGEGIAAIDGDAGHLLSYLNSSDRGVSFILIALAVALLMGAAHALSPGHGKVIVSAYLVGSRGTIRHAITLGIIVTITHVATIAILGLAALAATEYFASDRMMEYLDLFSALGIMLVGVSLLVRRIKHLKHGHEHGAHHHSHLDHHSDERSFRELLILGISGGIVPCPSAMIVMLMAIAIGKIGLGFAMIAAFSVGLAFVLSGIGILSVKAKEIFLRMPYGVKAVWMPILSALAVTLLGGAMVAQNSIFRQLF